MNSDGLVCLSFIFTCQTWLIIVLSLFIISLFVMNLYRRRIVRQLLDSYRQLASVMEHSSDAFFRFNMEGNFTWCSRSAAGILGVDQPEDLLGKSVLGYFMNPEDFHLTMRTILEKETLVDYEVKLHRKDGKVIIMAASANLVYENGQPVGVEGVARDITSRKEAEQAVRRSEERYRTLVESAGEAIFSVDGEGQLLFINSVAARRLGRQSQEIVGKCLADVFPQYLAEKYLKSIRGVIDSGVSVTIDSVSELQGIKYLYKTSLSPIREPDGRIHSVLGIARDVTSSIHTSQALESERNFIRLLLDTANSLIICLDKEVRLTVFNSECERVTGYRRDEVLGEKWSDIFLPREYLHEGLDDFEAWVKKYPSDRYEKDILTKSGERRMILWSNSAMHDPITGELTAIAIGHDITERKIGENALWESEEKYRRLVESSVNGIAIVRDETVVFVNQKMLELHGCTHKKEMEGRAFTDFVAPEFRELMKARGKARQSGQNVAERYIYKGLRRDGTVFDVDISVGCIVYGGQIAIQGILRDITEKLRIENALRETRTRFQEALENSLDILYRLNIKTGTYDYVSQSAERILGYTPVEIIKMGVEGMRRLAHPDDLKVMGGHRQSLINSSPGEDNSCTVEYRILCRDGQYRWLSDSHTLVRDSNGVPKFIMGTTRDITENKIAEMALRESEQFNKAVIENSPLGVSVRDKTGKLLSVNEAWTRIWGMPPEAVDEDMRRERPQLCFDKRDTYLGAWKDEVARVYREGGYLHIPEIRSELHRSGRPRWVSQHFYAIRDASGGVDRVVILTEDITGRKEVELALTDSESRFRAIAEATPIPIAITSLKDGRLLYANKLFAPAVGYDAEEITQVPFQQFYHNPEERQRLTDTIKEQGSIHNFESMGRKKDGSFYWALVTLTRIVYKGEEAIFGGFVDITERKKMEDALRESENRYALATSAARVGVWDWDVVNDKIILDPGIGEILGVEVPVPNLSFAKSEAWIYSEDLNRIRAEVHTFIQENRPEFELEFRFYRAPHKEVRWINIKGRTILDQSGRITRLVGTATDITERKQAEDALRESENRYALATSAARVGVWDWDVVNDRIILDPAVWEIMGLKEPIPDYSFAKGQAWIYPDDWERTRHDMETYVRNKTSEFELEFRFYRAPHKEVRWINIKGRTILDQSGSITRLLGTATDISERKQAEDALRESENRYALATAAARVGIWDWDLIRNIFYLDAGIGLILGADFTHKKPDFDQCMTWVNDEDKGKVISSVREYIDGSVSEFLMEFRIMRAPHHESRWVALRGRIIRDTEGKATRMLGTASDINDRKIAEMALVESEERFRNMADLLPQVVFEIDLEGNLLFVNQQAYDTFGYPHHADFRKMNVRMFFVPEDVPRALKSAREIQEGKISTGNEYTGLRRDGSTFPLMIYTSLIMKDNKPCGFRGIILDITSIKEAEARVRAADQERFEQAKRTAGVFAHEIRNALFPATVALGQVKKITSGNEIDESRFGRYNAMAEKAIGRAAEITRLITSYTRLDSEIMPEKVNLSEIIGEVIGQNEWQITEQKVIVKIGGKTGTWVVSNRRQLILALNNLLINALDALRERENPTLNIQWQTQNGNLLVKFRDNGSGVPEEIRGKIFEPFFTTRIERGGTGIGLPMAKRIIEMYGGDIRLNSRPGQGTTFEIRMIPAEASGMKLRREGETRE